MLSENYVILFQKIFWYMILRITNGTHRFCLNPDRKKPLQQSRLLRNPLDIKKKYFQVCRRFWKIIQFTVTILPKDTRLAWDFWVGARDDTSSKGKIVFTTGWPYLAEVFIIIYLTGFLQNDREFLINDFGVFVPSHQVTVLQGNHHEFQTY